MSTETLPGAVCPMPIAGHREVQLAHGGGGRLTDQLIEELRTAGTLDQTMLMTAEQHGLVLVMGIENVTSPRRA